MTGNLAHRKSENSNCTYQHIQGQMLIRLNKLSGELTLSHSEYRIMGALIGLWNKKHGMAFPTIEYLANICCMGKQTVIKGLNNLVRLNLLVVVKTPGQRNNYYFSNLLMGTAGSIHVIPQGGIACNTAHEHELTENKTNKKTSFPLNKLENDDANLNNSKDYQEVIMQLTSWSFVGGDYVIKKHSLNRVKKLLEIVKNKNPDNKGAYLRALLNLPKEADPEITIPVASLNEDYRIKEMLKSKYWEHIPDGRIYKVLPDMGTHLLIHFDPKSKRVTFIEQGFSDFLDNFVVADAEEYLNHADEKQSLKPSKEDIIQELKKQGNSQEAVTLSKIWKCSC